MFGCELVLLAIGPRLFDHFSSSLPFEFRSLKKNKIKFQFPFSNFFRWWDSFYWSESFFVLSLQHTKHLEHVIIWGNL